MGVRVMNRVAIHHSSLLAQREQGHRTPGLHSMMNRYGYKSWLRQVVRITGVAPRSAQGRVKDTPGLTT